jgi:hypothetical protein
LWALNSPRNDELANHRNADCRDDQTDDGFRSAMKRGPKERDHCTGDRWQTIWRCDEEGC